MRAKQGILIAAFLLLIHGLIEATSSVLVAAGRIDLRFAFDAMNADPISVAGFGVCLAIVRIVAFLGLIGDREWGLVLGIVVTAITLGVLTIYLPYGALDGALAVPVLLLLTVARFGRRRITESSLARGGDTL